MGSAGTIRRQTRSSGIPFSFRHHFSPASRPHSVAVVSADPEIRTSMTNILRDCSLSGIPANGLAEFKSVYEKTAPIACLCGFDLANGTFLDVADFMEEQSSQIPLITISPRSAGVAPAHFIDSLRAGALATICYPYRLSDVQIVLWSVIQYQNEFRQPKVESDMVPVGCRAPR